jgi:hypothetical protein
MGLQTLPPKCAEPVPGVGGVEDLVLEYNFMWANVLHVTPELRCATRSPERKGGLASWLVDTRHAACDRLSLNVVRE